MQDFFIHLSSCLSCERQSTCPFIYLCANVGLLSSAPRHLGSTGQPSSWLTPARSLIVNRLSFVIHPLASYEQTDCFFSVFSSSSSSSLSLPPPPPSSFLVCMYFCNHIVFETVLQARIGKVFMCLLSVQVKAQQSRFDGMKSLLRPPESTQVSSAATLARCSC